jgi:undecaprenyl phosphate N,N'-diacetylbacillosamine 1-phosphate transferase
VSMMHISKGGLYRRYIKRPMDLILSLIALMVLSPILLTIASLVRIKIGSPVFFIQKRPGLNEKVFLMYKFRTMTDDRNEKGELFPDSFRLTNLGRFLRSTSLDEIPELFNILKGDMSIVGPRPQLLRDMLFMTDKQRERHNVLPGLTGWAQVNGRNCITWDEKFSYDMEYIDNITFIGDIKIILKTISLVFKREGINSEGMDTAEDLGDYLLRRGQIDKKAYIEKLRNNGEMAE